jgi:hypothetical protein
VGKRPRHADALGEVRYWAERVYWRYVRHGAQHRRDALALQALAPLTGSIDRPGEQEIVRRWEDELGLSFERRMLNGIAVARA